MTDDIVKRLRLSADAYERASFKTQAAQLREAADRIEALGRVIDDALGHLEAGEPAEAAVILQTRRHHAVEPQK